MRNNGPIIYIVLSIAVFAGYAGGEQKGARPPSSAVLKPVGNAPPGGPATTGAGEPLRRDDAAVSYEWDFGDGTPHSFSQVPLHSYSGPGTFTWTLRVARGGEVCFQFGTITVAPASTPFYTWNFGDGSPPACGSNVTHAYTWPCTYTWTVTVRQDGHIVEKIGTITITCVTPSITTQPAGQTVHRGHTATLTVAATGSAPLHYAWYQGESGDTSMPAPGATDAPSYTTLALPYATSYWVRVSNACQHADSDTARVDVCDPPDITVQPASQMVPSGQTATLSVAATGSTPLHYAWYQGASGSTATPAPGIADAPDYTTPALTATTRYWVRVTNSCDQTDSATATVTICLPPSITAQPSGKSILKGQKATLTVTAAGVPPLHYVWFQGAGVLAVPAPGAADAPSYTTPALTATTVYSVRVYNDCEHTDSSEATISVYDSVANFTIGGFLGVGTPSPERAAHIKGPNAVFRLDRSKDTAAFMIVRNDDAGSILKSFLAGVNAAAAGNGSFVVSDLGAAVTGGGTSRLTIDNAGTASFGRNVKATGFVTVSSRRFKTDIRPIGGALATLGRLRGYCFNWRSSGEAACGLIAEDVERAAPELAAAAGGQPPGVDYAGLTALLLEGVREQQAQLDALKQKRERLEWMLRELERLGP